MLLPQMVTIQRLTGPMPDEPLRINELSPSRRRAAPRSGGAPCDRDSRDAATVLINGLFGVASGGGVADECRDGRRSEIEVWSCDLGCRGVAAVAARWG